jgi:NitT/TauT family transport system substrate-binding protein
MKSRNMLMSSAVAITMLAAVGCSSGSGTGAAKLKLEKTHITVDAFPAIDSAGLYIAQTEGLFAAQGLQVTIVPVGTVPPSTQDLIDGQLSNKYDITAGDYVTYIENEISGHAKLRIIAEASTLQPNVLALVVKGGSTVSAIGQLRGKTVSVNAPDDIGTLLVDSLLTEHGITPSEVKFNNNVAFPLVADKLGSNAVSASFAPEPFVSLGEEGGIQELADLDQGSTQDFPIQGYAVTQAWAKANPNTLEAFQRALNQGQEIADSNRAAVEEAVETYLHVPATAAAFISLPSFPAGVDSVRLQRVVSAMLRFNLLPSTDRSFKVSTMTGG